MSDVFTETSDESFFTRIKNAFFGVIVGILLIPGSIALIFYNEYRTITETHRLEKGQSLCVSDVSIDNVDPSLEGKLVHVKGKVHSDDHLKDKVFGIDYTGIALNRSTKIYQWVEHRKTKKRKKFGGGKRRTTEYRYEKEWVDREVNSNGFKQEGHENIPATFSDSSETALQSTLGAFAFPRRLVNRLSRGQEVQIKEEDLQKIDKSYKPENFVVNGSGYYYSPSGRPDPMNPKIGDQKITFHALQDAPVTLVSQQALNSFTPMDLGKGYTSLELIENEEVSSQEVFQRAHNANAMWKWILRIGSFVLMWIGFAMIMKPLAVLGDIIPFVGSLIEWGSWFIGFILAATISLISIAIAWFAVRPLLSAGILAVAGGLVFAIMYFRRKPTPPAQDLGVEMIG